MFGAEYNSSSSTIASSRPTLSRVTSPKRFAPSPMSVNSIFGSPKLPRMTIALFTMSPAKPFTGFFWTMNCSTVVLPPDC